MATGKKTACPVCHSRYAEAYLATHMRKAHDFDGGIRAWRKAHPPTNNSTAVEVYQPPKAPARKSKLPFPEVKLQMLPLAVFKDAEGRTWIAEQVDL